MIYSDKTNSLTTTLMKKVEHACLITTKIGITEKISSEIGKDNRWKSSLFQ